MELLLLYEGVWRLPSSIHRPCMGLLDLQEVRDNYGFDHMEDRLSYNDVLSHGHVNLQADTRSPKRKGRVMVPKSGWWSTPEYQDWMHEGGGDGPPKILELLKVIQNNDINKVSVSARILWTRGFATFSSTTKASSCGALGLRMSVWLKVIMGMCMGAPIPLDITCYVLQSFAFQIAWRFPWRIPIIWWCCTYIWPPF